MTPHLFQRRALRSGIATCLMALCGLAAAAFPDKPLKLVVPFPPGGAGDITARSLAQRLGVELGQQVLIENRGGAGGSPAAELVAKSAPDGYTLFFGTMGTHAINPAMYPKLPYDPVKDFAPIGLTHITPRVLIVGPSVAARSIDELIALAKAKPGQLTYGSAGNGSSGHLSGALFEAMAGVQMLHVPYKGSSPLLVDVLAGRIDLTFDSFPVYEESIKSGKVRALGVTSKSRISTLPAVPTIAEAGLKGYEVANWIGILAPAGTPASVITTLHTALGKVMATPAIRQQFVSLGVEPVSGPPEAFGALIRSELPKWAEIVKRAGAKIE